MSDKSSTITMDMRRRRVTKAEAMASAQRLINSHFNNKDSARVSIPVRFDDDDVTVTDYIRESNDVPMSDACPHCSPSEGGGGDPVSKDGKETRTEYEGLRAFLDAKALKGGTAEGIATRPKCLSCGHDIHDGERCRTAISVLPMQQCRCMHSIKAAPVQFAEADDDAHMDAQGGMGSVSPVTENLSARVCGVCGWEWYEHNSGRHCPSCAESKVSHPAPVVVSEVGESSSPLTFDAFQQLNALRSGTRFGLNSDWTLNDWAVALAGEVGELCNLLKKDRRGLAIDERFDLNGPYCELARKNVISELADVITYADLIMTKLGANTSIELIGKFNEVSRRVGFGKAGAVDHIVPAHEKVAEKDSLDALGHKIAYDAACTAIESNCCSVDAARNWFDVGEVVVEADALDWVNESVRYLEMRGLIERHADSSNWVSMRDESEASHG